MKKVLILTAILALGFTAGATGRDTQSTTQPSTATTGLSSAAQRKADSIYEGLRDAYAKGTATEKQLIDNALYHKAWNPQLTERCLRLVADRSSRAQAELGLLYCDFLTAYLFPGKTQEGITLLENSLAAGNKTAADYLGIYYTTQDDYDNAGRYFLMAAPDNTPRALLAMGNMYDTGKGFKKDRAKAVELFRKAALQGYGGGAAKYGQTLQKQWYGDVNMPEAFKWTYIAGELGDDFSRSNLDLPLRGERFGSDAQTEMMRRGMALGHAWNNKYQTPFTSSPMYIQGFQQGLPELQRQARNGDDWALFLLGSMSYNDEFLNPDDNFIYTCYATVAQHDKLPHKAMAVVYERLAEMFRTGRGTKVNLENARKFDQAAAAYGSLPAYRRVENIPE